LIVQPSAPQSPHRVGRYLLHTRLAVGGMAEVWMARQEGPAGFAKQLVVKKILPHLAVDRDFVQMFLNEARLAAQLNHPNVVQIFELGEEGGSYYLVMEYIHGRNLRSVQKRCRDTDREIPFGHIARILIGACEGLHYAHELRDGAGNPLDLVHRDMSPDNVLVSFDGQVKVVDFGIAKAANSGGATRTGTLKGKYAYMSPEQAQGQPLDRRADVYSLGVVLYELIAGEKPFRNSSDLAMLKAIVEQPPPPLADIRPDVPPSLVAIVERAMAKEKGDRYPDARSMGQELASYLREASERAETANVAELMGQLFAAEREELRRAGVGVTPPPYADDAPTGEQLGLSYTSADIPQRSKMLMPLTLVLAAGAVLGFFLIRSFWADTQPAVAVAAPPPAPRRSILDNLAKPTPPAPKPKEPEKPREPEKQASKAPEKVERREEPRPAPKGPPPIAVKSPRKKVVSAKGRPTPAPTPARETLPTPKPKGKGKIVIRVHPFADVQLDGEMMGVTPIDPIETTPGRHTITLVNGELGKTKTVPVEVKAGQETLVKINLLDE
jgi:serine/threonine-protein kinase